MVTKREPINWGIESAKRKHAQDSKRWKAPNVSYLRATKGNTFEVATNDGIVDPKNNSTQYYIASVNKAQI